MNSDQPAQNDSSLNTTDTSTYTSDRPGAFNSHGASSSDYSYESLSQRNSSELREHAERTEISTNSMAYNAQNVLEQGTKGEAIQKPEHEQTEQRGAQSHHHLSPERVHELERKGFNPQVFERFENARMEGLNRIQETIDSLTELKEHLRHHLPLHQDPRLEETARAYRECFRQPLNSQNIERVLNNLGQIKEALEHNLEQTFMLRPGYTAPKEGQLMDSGTNPVSLFRPIEQAESSEREREMLRGVAEQTMGRNEGDRHAHFVERVVNLHQEGRERRGAEHNLNELTGTPDS